jgi:Tfp pilus assembly protein PilF
MVACTALGGAALCARAELPAWMQDVISASAIESALYRLMDLPGLKTIYPRPPAEARTELSSLIKKSPADAELYSLRAQSDEQALDFAAAEADWKQYVAHSADSAAATLQLAGFYHRRLQPEQEVHALMAVAAAPSPASEQYTPAVQQRAWAATQRILHLADDQALPPQTFVAAYQAWIARYPAEPAPRVAYVSYLIREKRFDDAVTAIAEYKRAFPQDAVFPIKASALVEYRRGSVQSALAIYDANFQPLWPAELVQSYYGMLAVTHRQRQMLADARASLIKNPDDFVSAVRIFYYFQQQGHLDAARAALDSYRASKEQRKAKWTADELYISATLFDGVSLYGEAARYYFALYNADGALSLSRQSPQEAALSGIVHVLLTAPDQNIPLGAGNLSLYRDIATLDQGPGYLNGILSLWLNSASPASAFHDEEKRALPYYHRAKAQELLAVLDQKFPQAAARPALHAQLIAAYVDYGDNPAILKAGENFLKEFPTAPERIAVDMDMADAYARTSNTTAEFALYDRLLTELAAQSKGMPLTADAASSPAATVQTNADAHDTDTPDEGEAAPSQPAQGPSNLERALDLSAAPPISHPVNGALNYSQLLERYLGRLSTAHQLPAALAVLRRELDRNPNDPLLYERLAAFLQQNNFTSQQEEVYRRAIARFNDTDWYAKLARYYLRQQRQHEYSVLTHQVIDSFRGSDLSDYLGNAGSGGWPQVYLEVNLYAHQRFPHNLQFTHNLLNAYSGRNTPNSAAWEQLIREHWFESSDLRDQFFDYLQRTNKLDAELAALQQLVPADARQQNPAAMREIAEADLWQSHFEQSAPLLGKLAAAYPAEVELGTEASSVFRSLAYADSSQTALAIAVEKNLLAADPANLDRLARIGDIYSDNTASVLGEQNAGGALTAAAQYWRRMPLVHPGSPDGYLQSATVFWDYFQFDDALEQITLARNKFHNPSLYGYEAGAIDENKRDYAQAIAEYTAAATSEAPNDAAHRRLVVLAQRPAFATLVDAATAHAVAQKPTLAALALRADVLAARKQKADIATLTDAAIQQAATLDDAAQLATFAQQRQLTASYQHALQREIALAVDPVERIQLRYTLAQSYTAEKNLPAAQQVIESTYKDNPKILGVVRTTVDFYWTNKHQSEAIATLTQAAHDANPTLSRAFTVEAASKSNESGDYAGARRLIEQLLTADPYNARYIAIVADSYALSGDNASLRDFYTAKLASIKDARMSVTERRDNIVFLRQGLIPALTRMKDYAAGMDQQIALLSAFPEDTDIIQSAALYGLRYGRQQQLLAFLNKTVADSPRDSRFAIALGNTNTIFEDYSGAIAAYVKAIAIRKDHMDIYIAKANLEERLQRFDDAVSDYDRLYILSYKDSQWMFKVAQARARQRKNDLAVRALQTAWIDGRPVSPQNQFRVAAQLEQWNLLDEARTFAEQGVKLAGDDLLAVSVDRDGATTYARILARQRHADAALAMLQKALDAADESPNSPSVIIAQAEKQGITSVVEQQWRKDLVAQRKETAAQGFLAIIRQVGVTVATYYTPEEKLAYAHLLDAARSGKPLTEVVNLWIPAAESAGLQDHVAQWRRDVLLANPHNLDAGLDAFNALEKQRMENAVRGETIERYAELQPARDRNGTLALAADAWRDDANHAAELRVLGKINLRGAGNSTLRDRYFSLLLQSDSGILVSQTASANNAYAESAATYVLAHGNRSLAASVVESMSHGRTPLWHSANTALIGLYYADGASSTQNSATSHAFHDALDDTTIGERLAAPANTSQHFTGDLWFYYGMRYGVFRTVSHQDDAEDFLAAGLESRPGVAASYVTLAEAYTDARQPDAAVREYDHALELEPSSAGIHRSIAAVLWASGHKADAIAQWQQSLALLHAMVDLRAVPESFWTDFTAISRDLQQNHLGAQLQPEMDAVLRSYITKNGEYRSIELLHSAFTALDSPAQATDWALSLAGTARYPASLLAQLTSADWIPQPLLGRIYRRELELAQAPAQHSSDMEESASWQLNSAQADYLKYLLKQKSYAEAQIFFDSLDAARRKQNDMQPLQIELAAHQGRISQLLAAFASSPTTAPSLDVISRAANDLRETDKPSSRQLLEYVFQRKLEQHLLTAPDFLSLAQARLDTADVSGALELLHRMTMLDGDIYANFDAAAKMLEDSGHAADALPFLTALAGNTPWNVSYRVLLAQAQLASQQNQPAALAALASVAADSTAAYDIRVRATTALHAQGSKQNFGSSELNLLASGQPITIQQADQPYFVAARIAAASTASAQQKTAILRAALAVAPSDALRLSIFHAEISAGNAESAFAAINPLLIYRYDPPQTSDTDSDQPDSTPADDSSDSARRWNYGDDAQSWASGSPLSALVRTREEKLAMALELASMYEKLNQPAQQMVALRDAVKFVPDDKRLGELKSHIAKLQARIALDQANAPRLPRLHPTLEQSALVRPRLTRTTAPVQEDQP